MKNKLILFLSGVFLSAISASNIMKNRFISKFFVKRARLISNFFSIKSKLILILVTTKGEAVSNFIFIKKRLATNMIAKKIQLITRFIFEKNKLILDSRLNKIKFVSAATLRNKLVLILSGVFLSITLTGVANESANPFNPIFSSTLGGATDAPAGTEGKHPLQQYPVKNYILMGVIASSNANIALIRARNGEEYFVRVGNLLGNTEGKITKINGVGVEVSEKDRVVSLMVRNRSMSNEKTE